MPGSVVKSGTSHVIEHAQRWLIARELVPHPLPSFALWKCPQSRVCLFQFHSRRSDWQPHKAAPRPANLPRPLTSSKRACRSFFDFLLERQHTPDRRGVQPGVAGRIFSDEDHRHPSDLSFPKVPSPETASLERRRFREEPHRPTPRRSRAIGTRALSRHSAMSRFQAVSVSPSKCNMEVQRGKSPS